ncbi:response regulator transcription factor [Scleromatobacter humisilvae]|uniref:Response regulator transcription factor n=1 Tax=Scleromatobacter humisilvae TaxID=2897159 RepID=A0A9X1YNG7_9BURK|nr:response regulator transcription factor [Scleromatobacter humisilvae]MCK9689246.1 response regulator transcription factor [Scleromatobacter humisilvae]
MAEWMQASTDGATARGEAAGVVLIVDDIPDNLAVLHDALDESGYTVLVATDGASAIARAAQALPDIVLLDALMPGMDGFEVARRLKADEATAPIPIVFMTALTDTEHVLAAFAAGGVDYVSKPVRPREVVARIAAHLQSARHARQARNALDAFGHASIALRPADGRVLWQTPLARDLMKRHFGAGAAGAPIAGTGSAIAAPLHAPASLCDWVRARVTRTDAPEGDTWTCVTGTQRLHCSLHPASAEDEWLLVLTESSNGAAIEALSLQFRLTAREAEVLYWVAHGKTNRDIGDILGTRPKTITKHLEHVFEKLGVETRTAAAARVLGTLPELMRRK